ncbi:MAG: CotH kinase family protein [Fibrobacterales bacterium]
MQKLMLVATRTPLLISGTLLGSLILLSSCARDGSTAPESDSGLPLSSSQLVEVTPDSTQSSSQGAQGALSSSTTTETSSPSTETELSSGSTPQLSFAIIPGDDTSSNNQDQSSPDQASSHNDTTQPDASSSQTNTSGESSSSSSTTTTPSNFTLPLNDSADYLFDQDVIRDYHLILDPDSLALIDLDPEAENYVGGSIVLDGDTIGPVGIRYNGGDCGAGRLPKTCPKLSLKVKLTWSTSNLRLYGKKKLNFKAMRKDETQMHERLGLWLFNKMGVKAPRAAHAKVFVNGTYTGLFTHVEEPDGKFTKAHFSSDGDGNLYKNTWPTEYTDTAKTETNFINNLETNTSTTDVTLIKGFADAIISAGTPSNAAFIIKSYMDIPTTMSYIAVDRAIRNDQGIFHWDCNSSKTNCEPDNFLWYEEPNNQLLSIVPWDLDKAFENISGENNANTYIKDLWNVKEDCTPFDQGDDFQISAACDDVIEGLGTFSTEYTAAQAKLKPIMGDALLFLEHIKTQIADATGAAHTEYGIQALSLSDWESAVLELKSDIESARSGLP